MNGVEVKFQNGRAVIGRSQRERRLQELAVKANKTQPDTLEEILLRLRRIEEHMGISEQGAQR